MIRNRIERLLKKKEHVQLKFKTTDTMPGNLFETICTFLNHDGGDILLGVND